MSLAGLGTSKYFAKRMREGWDERIRRMREQASGPRTELVGRVDELEDDFGRALLLLQTLAELCVSKGILTRDEITAMAARVDKADGVKDGKLDPNVTRPESKRRENAKKPVSPKEHLRQLEETARE